MAQPRVLVLTEQGINCEDETKFAFELAGALTEIVHLQDLIDNKNKLSNYQILAIPGGFSYGDHTGSGKAFANRLRNNYWDEIKSFTDKDTLTIGICNGFQVLVNSGLLPNLDGNNYQQVALTHNEHPRYNCRWVDVKFQGEGPWVRRLSTISMPIAHGEGRFYAENSTLMSLYDKNMIAAQYVHDEMCEYQHLSPNPNGSLDDIAAITSEDGRILGMMPHPERAIDVTHRPDWPLLKEQFKRAGDEMPQQGPGLKLFKNAVEYFQ